MSEVKAMMTGHEVESEGGVIEGSPGAVRARAGGASIVQIEHGFGKNSVVVLWLSAIVSAAAVIALLFTMAELKRLSAKYEVLQYDHQALKAQLVARGIYEGTEH